MDSNDRSGNSSDRLARAVEVLIAITLDARAAEPPVSVREKISRLDMAGLDPAAIARILNKDRTAVNSELAKIRSAKPKRK